MVEALAERRARAVEAGCVDEHDLGVIGAHDAPNRVAGRLGTWRGDRHLGSDQSVHQCRLANVGSADDGDKARLHEVDTRTRATRRPWTSSATSVMPASLKASPRPVRVLPAPTTDRPRCPSPRRANCLSTNSPRSSTTDGHRPGSHRSPVAAPSVPLRRIHRRSRRQAPPASPRS